jgi:CRP-like cAMP-binding protein|tara:strand:- start:901 stop:1455 length:555 start_codon:yes stop_codon:yes gene_type:complete
MIIVDVYFQLFSVITFILMLSILVYYLLKINKVNTEIENSKNIIEKILNELRHRLYSQDQKILDLDVKLNIVELRLSKYSNQLNINNISKSNKIYFKEPIKEVISHKENISQINMSLTETEKKILNILSYKDYTANELQLSIDKTREHTSRLLNKLFQSGYITRNENKKPYVYKLSIDNNIISE